MLKNLTYFLRDNGACGYYRCELPLETLGHKTGIAVRKIEKGDNAEEIERCLDADIVVIPRVNDVNMLKVIEHLKKAKTRVIVDFDDNVFHVSPFSPHYRQWGTENVKCDVPGQGLVTLWEDGKNIDLKKNIEVLDCAKRGIEMADAVTVTTEILANEYRQYGGNVKALPNCIDTNLWQKLPLKRHNDEIRLSWAGGSSHYEDWVLLQDVLPPLFDKYKNLKLVLLGNKFDGTLKHIPISKIEFHEWVPTPAYSYKMAIADADIALIPLRETEFKKCISPIKWIEYSSLEVPAVVSYVDPYRQVATLDNGVWIEDNDPTGWVSGISMLVEDKTLRENIASNARMKVLSDFDINTKWNLWDNFYKELL